MGSQLVRWDSGEPVWPGSFWSLLTGRSLHALPFPIDGLPPDAIGDELVAGELFYEIAGRDFYGRIVATLADIGGYRCVPPAQIDPTTDCVLFSWDWRRSLVDAAARLDRVVERLSAARDDPTLRVDIVAHSAGGLVARYFLRYGGHDLQDEAWHPRDARVRRFVMIGTPNFGATAALQQAMAGKTIGFGTLYPAEIATFPSVAQLFPHPRRNWMIDIHGEPLDLDVYDPELWAAMRWGIYDPDEQRRIRRQITDPIRRDAWLKQLQQRFAAILADGRRFAEKLDRPLPGTQTSYVVFGGSCIPTPSRCLIERVGQKALLRLKPGDIRHPDPNVDYERLMLAPGDGSVTKDSLLGLRQLAPAASGERLFPVAQAVFICEQHERLPDNITFRDNLLNTLLY